MASKTTKVVKAKPAFSLEKFTPVLLLLIVVLSFAVGYLFNKVNSLEDNSVAPTATAPQPQAPANGKLSQENAEKLPKPSQEDHIRGSLDAEVIVIEYSDYECPFCSRFHPTMLQVIEEYGDDVAWIYRHFPLETLHPQAIPAAIASECVAELGGNDKFWEYTDYLFENQETALSDLAGSAAAIGMNQTAVQSCIDSDKYEQKVNDHYTTGAQAGVSGTPGNFIINKQGEVWSIPGAVPFTSLKATLDEALGN